MLNANGERFVDEGADFRNYTYAKYGAVILRQPGQFAWQVFDAKAAPQLRDEYRIRQVTRVRADSLQELVAKLDGVDAEAALATLRTYNAAVMSDVAFDPSIKDGRGTRGLPIPKSNWANPIDTPPFEAYPVTCGVTFTFGGLAIDERRARAGAEQRRGGDPGFVRGRRTGRRPVLLQLPWRNGPDGRRRLRPHRRRERGPPGGIVITLRDARPDDAAMVQAIEVAAAGVFETIGMGDAGLDEPSDLADIARSIAAGEVIVACDTADAPLAAVTYREVDGHLYIAEIDVLPSYARRGIGAALLDEISRRARARGLRGLTLSTFRDVPWNAPYYRRLGFTDIPDEQLSAQLLAIRTQHIERGLDEGRRTFMQRLLPPSS